MGRIQSFREPGPRYPALRVIGFLCTLFGAILMAIGVGLMLLTGLYAIAARGAPVDFAPQMQVFAGFSLLWSFGILFSGLQLVALGGFLRLMIHVEENTRASAQALDRIHSRLEANPERVGPFFES
jgi:hypothetical protein